MTTSEGDPTSSIRARTPLGASGPRRTLVVGSLVVIVALTIGGVALSFFAAGNDGPEPLSARIDPLIADLTIAPFSEFTGSRSEDGTERIRFGVIIANLGEGDFQVGARRNSAFSDDWTVVQRIPERGGGFTERDTPARLLFGGDGHDHWHIRDVEEHQLETLDGKVLGSVVKQGYCFFDTTPIQPDLPGAPEAAIYHSRACGGKVDNRVSMGLSIGWGDEYPWHMLDQQIDITGTPDGRYRLRAIADPHGWFDELDDTNNEYWEEFELTRDSYGIPEVRVTRTSVDP